VPAAPTPRIEHGLADLVAAGIPLQRAAAALGIPRRQVKKWVELGRAGSPEFERFAISIDAARTERQHHVEEMLAQLRDRLNGH
jgi:hypothetical protein